MNYRGRFEECRSCIFFTPAGPARECLNCTAGEMFEPVIDEGEPDENDLIDLFSFMEDDD